MRAREIEEKFISIFEQTPDPIGILDAGGRIIDVNGGFQSLFGRSAAEVCGKRLSDLGLLLPVDPVRGGDLPVEGGAVSRYEIPVITRDGASFAAQVAIQRIMISNQPCLLVLIHDIDAIRRAHDAVAQANHKLKILSSITRHDILNRISITMLNTDLLRTRLRDPAQIRYLDIIDQVSGEIQSLISFTRQYESVGSDEPSWCRVEEILRSHQIRDLVPGIPIESDLGSLELYADPMIGKVFYNLVENSARHGRDLTRIRVSCVQRADELILVYEDDGGGIPSSSREFVFDQGFGENTGLGLFLIREILAITGMRISETGEGGTGVRFEIRVPAGRFRTPDL